MFPPLRFFVKGCIPCEIFSLVQRSLLSPPSVPPHHSFCDVSQEVTGCLHCLQVPRQGMQLLRSAVALLPSDDPGCSFSPPRWMLVSRLPHAASAAVIERGGMLMPFCFPDHCFPVSSYLGAFFRGG